MQTKSVPTIEFFKCMGNPTRYNIFLQLMEGVLCNCDIAGNLKISLSLASHHLHALEDLGLVKSERDTDDARWIYFQINPDVLGLLQKQCNELLNPKNIKIREIHCSLQHCDIKTSQT